MEGKCKLCDSCFDFRMVQIKECLGKMGISLSGHVNQVNSFNRFKYCPECGKELTKANFSGNEI